MGFLAGDMTGPLMLSALGFDKERGVELFQCDQCGEFYGKVPGSLPLKDCARCKDRERTERFKRRIYEAQKGGIQLAAAIQKHQRAILDSEFEITSADKELYEALTQADIQNDAPSGIMAIIEESDDATKF